jgi:hypothetical protein
MLAGCGGFESVDCRGNCEDVIVRLKQYL